MFDDSPGPEWIDRLGQEYEIMNLYFKPFACCRWAQPAIAGALQIARQNSLSAGDVRAIRVRTFEAATKLSRAHPRDTEEAQYCLPYPVAATLVDGELGPRQILPPRIFDTGLLALADRVETVIDPHIEREFPAKACAEVQVETCAGQSFTSGVVEAPWQPPAAPPTDADLEAKFRWLVDAVLGEVRARAIMHEVQRLETVDDVRPLMRLCIVP